MWILYIMEFYSAMKNEILLFGSKWMEPEKWCINNMYDHMEVTKSQVPVAHTYNTRYSGGRHQENYGMQPAWAKCSRPYLKNIQHKMGLVKCLVVEHLHGKCEALSSNHGTINK
jgi:hypothetical protein